MRAAPAPAPARVPALALLIAATVIVAGCLTPSGDDIGPGSDGDDGIGGLVPADWALRALDLREDHDHGDAAQHANMSTPNFRLVGWDPLITDHYGTTAGSHLCGDVSLDGDRRIAVTHSFSSDVAFVLVDVTDPAKPEKLGELVLPRVHVYDVAIQPDASHVVLATSLTPGEVTDGLPVAAGGADAVGDAVDQVTASEPITVTPIFRDRCGNEHVGQQTEMLPYQAGTVLVDVTDLQNPVVADYAPQPGIGVHSIFATEVDGTEFVLSATTNLIHQASYFTIHTVDELPGVGARLVEYGTYQAQYAAPGAGPSDAPLINGHVDGWIHAHPGTNDTLAYLANWNGGVIVVRMNGPGQLETLGRWTDYEPDEDDPTGFEELNGPTGQYHEALPMEELWDGRHYTFTGQEVLSSPEGRPTGQVVMLDTTDPADPTPVARWTLPADVQWGDVGAEGLLFSTHYVEVVDRTLFVALYHGGVWAVGTEPVANTTELPTLGVYVPSIPSPEPPGDLPTFADWVPTVLEVVHNEDGNGTLTIFDGNTGVYEVRFDPAMEGVPVPEPWTADAWIDG